MRPVWQILYDAGADVVLSGHEHNYERFAPQDPSGRFDRNRGIRQFVVGTGGVSHYPFGRILETSEARNAETFGVLVVDPAPGELRLGLRARGLAAARERRAELPRFWERGLSLSGRAAALGSRSPTLLPSVARGVNGTV